MKLFKVIGLIKKKNLVKKIENTELKNNLEKNLDYESQFNRKKRTKDMKHQENYPVKVSTLRSFTNESFWMFF